MPMIPFDEWTRGTRGEILVCGTCYDRKARGRRTVLRSGHIPTYKTERGAAAHGDRFPLHHIEGVVDLRERVLAL